MTYKKTILITGSNAGIGFITAKHAALAKHRVILACRSMPKAEKAKQEILQLDPNADVWIRPLDLGSFDSIRKFAETIERDFPVVDALVNNAGIYPMSEEYTAEGFEMQFGVNYLGHFLLSHLLLPVLSKAPAARIVHVSSVGHMMGNIKPNTFRGRKFYLWGMPAYGQSKLANVMLSNELSRRLPVNMTSNAVHPGYVDSDFFRNIPGFIYKALRKFLVSAEFSGKHIQEMAVADGWNNRTGEFISSQGPLPKSRKLNDLKLSNWLYEESCRLTGVEPVDAEKLTRSANLEASTLS